MVPQVFAGARAAGLALFAAALLSGCGSDDNPQTPTATPVASRLVVDTGTAAPVAGGTLTLKATLLAVDGTELKGASFAWASSDSAVATVVSASDKAPAASVIAPVGTYATIQTLTAGSADITATATLADGSRITSVTHLVVQAAPAKSYTLVLTPASLVVTAGGAAQTVTVAVRRSDGVDGAGDLANWSWTSDDASFTATPSSDGRSAQVASPMSATAAGAAVLTACADAPAVGQLCAKAALSRNAAPPPTYTVGGTVSGLAAGKSLQLSDTNGDRQVLNADGTFAMPTPRLASTPYAITVAAQPAGQTCTVVNGAGSVASSNVTNIAVSCVQAQFVVIGNRDDRTLSVYRIDPSSGGLAPVPGSPFAALGMPIDVAFSPSGRVGYALLEDSYSLATYTLDASSGALSLATSTPAMPGSSSMAVDPQGRFVAVLANGTVQTFQVDSRTKLPSPLSTSSWGSFPSVMTINYGGDYLYLLSSVAGTLWQIGADPAQGYVRPSSVTPFPFLNVRTITGSDQIPSLYATDATSPLFYVARTDGISGTVVSLTPWIMPFQPVDIALSPNGEYGYILGGGQIQSSRLDFGTGFPTGALATVSSGADNQRLRVDPSNRFVYSPAVNGAVYGFAINSSDGSLSAVPGSPFPAGNGNRSFAIVEPKP